jgi:hypothetical protein
MTLIRKSGQFRSGDCTVKPELFMPQSQLVPSKFSRVYAQFLTLGLAFSLALGTMLLVSCGPAALPQRTQKPVSPQDLVGIWRYKGDYNQTTVEIEFLQNRTFRQTVTLSSGAVKKQQGTWQLNGAEVELENILLNTGAKSTPSLMSWKPDDMTWWFTTDGGNLELMGGQDVDPDQARELERQTPAP